MATQRALVSLGPGRAQVVSAPRIASVPDRFILVKTVAVALNPIDWKVIDAGVNGTIIGCDYAGVVEEVGEGVTKAFKKGDRVYGTVHGCNLCSPDGGAFAEYVVAKGDLQTKVPDHLTFEEAATFGAGILTVCQGLFQHLGLALPSCPLAEGVAILIYGGSSATGSLAIQFARCAGYAPITVCSPRNFAFVKSLGAVAAFDYHDPQCGQQIREYTQNKL